MIVLPSIRFLLFNDLVRVLLVMMLISLNRVSLFVLCPAVCRSIQDFIGVVFTLFLLQSVVF